MNSKVLQFVREHAVACGGDWTAMLMSAIRDGMPEVWATMQPREYTFVELWNIIEENLNVV